MNAELTADHVRSLGLTGRDFLRELDFTAVELNSLLDLAASLKQLRIDNREPELLKRKNLAAIFEKTSTRTRISFSVAMADQGGQNHLPRRGIKSSRSQGIPRRYGSCLESYF